MSTNITEEVLTKALQDGVLFISANPAIQLIERTLGVGNEVANIIYSLEVMLEAEDPSFDKDGFEKKISRPLWHSKRV